MENPFANIMTPETLKEKRKASVAERFGSRGFYVGEAARAGLATGDALRGLGLNKSTEDLKAERNAEILSGAQKRYDDYMAQGMEPDEAQESILSETISAFSSQGNYEAANNLLPHLQALKSQRAQRMKLYADADESVADAEARRAGIPLDKAKAEADVEKTKAETRRADAEARKADRWTPASERAAAGGSDGDPELSVFEKKVRERMETVALGAQETLAITRDVRRIMLSNPRALTDWGPVAQQIARVGDNAKYALTTGGIKDPNVTREGSNAEAKIKTSVASAELQSLTLSLAFALAKANDPGGRLSNQDVNQAIAIVSGTGGVKERLAVLDSATDRIVRPAVAELSARGRQYQLDPRYMDILMGSVNEYEALKKEQAAPPKSRTVKLPNGKTVTIEEE